jgi:hypothetical protein
MVFAIGNQGDFGSNDKIQIVDDRLGLCSSFDSLQNGGQTLPKVSDDSIERKMNLFVQIHPHSDVRIPQSFEGLVEAIGSLPGMYFEMDGSLVWVDHYSNPPAQMDAMVYDRDGRIQYIEVKGDFNERQWRGLCQAVCVLPLDIESENFDYSSLSSIIRVHRIQDGRWTSAESIATVLG